MVVYIKNHKGILYDDWCFTAYKGFEQSSHKIKLFEYIEDVPVSKNVLLVSNLTDTQEYLSKLNIAYPRPLNIPNELIPYAERKVATMPLKSFIETARVPVFVKPVYKNPGLPSGILRIQESFKWAFHNLDPEMEVQTSDYTEFLSEYRGYVIDSKLEAVHWYAGSFDYYPKVDKIREAIRDYTNAPAGYSIDFGITDKGKTVLIECNDGWSLGSYGCDPQMYSRLLMKRWIQLTK